MSQTFSACESGCSSCSVRSSSLGPAALPDPPRVSRCREKPLLKVSIGLGLSLLEAKPGAGRRVAGGQGVAAAHGPIPQPVMLWVAVLGKENWKTNDPDLQLVLGEAGGWKLPREEWPAVAGGLAWLGALPKASPATWFTRGTLCPSAGPVFGDWHRQRLPPAMFPALEHHPAVPPPAVPAARVCSALALPVSCPKLEGVEPWALLVGSFPASSSQEDPPAP